MIIDSLARLLLNVQVWKSYDLSFSSCFKIRKIILSALPPYEGSTPDTEETFIQNCGGYVIINIISKGLMRTQ